MHQTFQNSQMQKSQVDKRPRTREPEPLHDPAAVRLVKNNCHPAQLQYQEQPFKMPLKRANQINQIPNPISSCLSPLEQAYLFFVTWYFFVLRFKTNALVTPRPHHAIVTIQHIADFWLDAVRHHSYQSWSGHYSLANGHESV